MNIHYDTKTAQMYQVHRMVDKTAIANEGLTLGMVGHAVEHKAFTLCPGFGNFRHPLTPLDDTNKYVLAMKLGLATVNIIRPEVLPRVTGEVRASKYDEWVVNSDGKPQQSAGLGNGHHIILSPPEPEPKTAVELLDDVIKAFDKWKEYENSLPFIESIEAARNRTE